MLDGLSGALERGGGGSFALPILTPWPTQPPIARDSILVVSKRSRYERDQQELALSDAQMMKRYEELGESGARVLSSHERQRAAVAVCSQELSEKQVIRVEDLRERLQAGGVGAIIALGGDDFLKLVSQLVDDVPVLGVNSDPVTSSGVLLSTPIDSVGLAIRCVEAGCYRIEEWTRIQLTIDGRDCGRALNDVVFGKRDFRFMSRHQLEYRGERLEQRSSGLLVATGVGSTGWYSSAGLYFGDEDRSFPRTEPELRFELREPQPRVETRGAERSVTLPPHSEGRVLVGETIRITSLNDGDGIASRDSLDTIPFQRGAVAEIGVSQSPLKVIIPEVLQ